MARRTFEQWMREVDAEIASEIGLTSDDLPDCLYRDWYDDEVTPQEAAKRALRNAGWS